jgi:hypothetical protein
MAPRINLANCPPIVSIRPVQVIIFTACKHASKNNRLLSITNAFANLLFEKLPAGQRFSIASRLFFNAAEEGRFVGNFRLVDPDGAEVTRSVMEFDVKIHDSDTTGVFVDAIGELAVNFRTAGEYHFMLEASNQEPIVIPFYVAVKTR